MLAAANRPGSLTGEIFDSIVIFYSAQPELLPSLKVPKNVNLVDDPKAEIFAQLNPLWVGRWYIFKNGTLLDLQKSPEQKPPWSEDYD